MASDFLKRMSQQQAEKVDREYGADAYGGSKWRAERTGASASSPSAPAAGSQTELAAPAEGGSKKSSAFLQSQAKSARERIDREYGADAYGGSNYKFSTSGDQKQQETVSWPSVERAQADLQSWGGELDSLYAQLETAKKDTQAKAQELESIYTRLQAYQADSRFGSDTLIRSAYDNLARQYNELLPAYLEAATAHDSMAEEYNALLQKYQSGYTAYTDLLSSQGERAAQLLQEAEQAEQEAKEAQTVLNGVNRYGTAGQKEEWEAKLEEAESRAAALREQAEQARAYYYASVPMMEDYAQYSKATEAKRKADVPNLWKFWEDNGDDLYDFINNLPDEDGNGYRDYVALMSMGTGQDGMYGGYTPYSYMTEEEIGVYNYLYATAGREAAEAFLEEIMNSLNYRQGEENYENLSGVGKALYWLPAGVDRFASGIGQLFSEKALPTSPIQYTSSMVSQAAHDTSPILGTAYDLGTTVSNMAPSILLGSLSAGILGGAGVAAGTAGQIGGAIGSASMGLSAGGNAYTQKVNEGYTPEQARSYATLVGISESALQYLLGGISGAGGASSEQILSKLAPRIAAIDNALLRTVVNGGVRLTVRGVSEGIEEGLQEMLEPAFATLIMDEEYNWGENFENAAYSFLMGFLASGVFEGISMAAGGANTGGFDADMDGYMGQAGTDYFAGCNTAEEVEARYRELAREHHPDLGGDTATMADINRQHDMRKAWFMGQQQAQEQGETQTREQAQERTEDVQPLSLPSLTEETDAAPAAGPATPPSPAVQTQQTAPAAEIPGANYAQALQRAGADVDTARTVGYLLYRAEQGMTLTEDQRAYIATVPGGAVLMEQAQPAVQRPQEARQQAGANLPGQETIPAGEAAQGAAGAIPGTDTTIGGLNDGRQEQLAERRPGDGVPDGRQGRLPGAGAGEQTGGLGTGAARATAPAEQGRTAISRQNRGKYLRAEKVSSLDLGLPNGTESPSVSVVREADWDEGLRSTAERVRRETGLPVTYVLGSIPIRDGGGTVRSVRGVYGPDRIILQADNLRVTTDQIADHEIFHDKAFQTPGLVREIELKIMERYSREEFEEVAAAYVERLRGVVDLSENATPDEIDAAMQIIKEEIFADAYAGINAFAAHAERFQEDVNETLEERGLGRETAAATDRTTGPPTRRYSYGGRNANQADSTTLARAEEMERAGTDTEAIRQETGWFRGADGKWRFEIDDSGMAYHDRSGGVPGQTLADYLTHDELFQNYPQLRKTRLEFAPLGRGIQGQYDAGTDTITLAEDLREAPEDTLIHEIQHAIQRAEGFAKGANDKFWSRQLESGYDGRTQEQLRETQRLRQEYGTIREREPEFFRDMMELNSLAPDMPRGKVDFETLEQIEEDPPEWQRYDAAREAMEEKYGDTRVWDFDNLLYKLKQSELAPGRTGTELYYDTAGEIEARDVARRRQLTAAERRARRPDTGNEDTVFVEGIETDGWYAASYDPETSSIKEQIEASRDQLNSMDVVASATVPTNLPNKDAAAKWASDRLKATGYKVDRKGYGEIYFSKKDIDKGLRYADTPEEKAALAVLPQVLKRGIEIGGHGQHKGRAKQTITFAAPVELNGIRGNMAVVVNRHGNHYYAHRIVLPDGTAFRFAEGQNNAAQELSRGVTVSGSLADTTSAASDVSITQNNQERKGEDTEIQGLSLPTLEDEQISEDSQGRDLTPAQEEYFRGSQARDDAGRLLTLYHQTAGSFTVFDPRHEGAGTRDSGTPFGIFLKTSPRDIGLRGKQQMELYANITNPLRCASREDLDRALRELSPEYAAIADEHAGLDDEYHGKFEAAKKELRDFMTRWREENPDAGRRDLYDVPEFNRLYDAEDVVVEEWTEKADELSRRSKEEITRALKGAGYDGVILSVDAGSFGRSTDAYIALEPEQVKNVTNQTPTRSPDIRYSVDEDADLPAERDEEDLKERQFAVIQESNPADDDYHTWIRSAEEIKTFQEALADEEWADYDSFDPDYTREMADAAVESGRIQVYSSYPIERGVFVTPSLMEAESYAGGGQIHSKTVRLTDVAWIDPTQGQYAPVPVRYSVDEAPAQEDQEQPEEKKRAPRRSRQKPVAESLPIIAKRDLKQNLLNLFSIPEGMRAELGAVIDQVADRLLKNGELTQADRDAFFERMYADGVMTVPAEEYYALGRDAVKGGRVYVSQKDQHEFGDDWNSFRRRAFANGIYFTNNPGDQGIDVWNMELAEMMPGLFDASELDNRAILERIVQVAEEGKDQKMSLAEYAAELVGREYVSEDEILDNMERQMDWALRTFAEKAKLEIKLRDRTGVKIAQEREKFSQSAQRQREKEMLRRAEERDRRREQIQRQRENRELRELQQRTLKQLQWLSKNRHRAPAELKDAWDEVLGDIDIYAVGAANEMNWSNKYQATWRDLAQLYKTAQETDPNFLPSKELERIVARLDGDKIADLDVDALADLYKAAVGLRTEFYNRNNVMNDEMGRLFAEVYADAKREIETAPGGYKGKGLDKFMNLDQLTPMNVMQRMGGWDPRGAFYSMAKQLEKGERDIRAYTVQANRRLEEFLTEYEDWVKKADGQGKDGIWYEIEVPELLELGMGDKPIFGPTIKVYMTPSQKVHMYLESKSPDNLRHMTGGRTFVDRELYSQGKRQEAFAQGRTIRLAPETVKGLVANLTEEEAELARILEDYYNNFAKGEINRVANILYGYDKAQSRSYAPIYTNRNYVKSEIGIFDTTAEGVGNLKSRQYAKNPSYNISAFDAFERHVEQTARFVGMAIPARNWQTLLNWREKNNSMGDVITHKWGEESKKYIEDLLNRLQGGAAVERDTVGDFADKVLSNYISAVFGANPSIVLKQLGSIPLASAYLGGTTFPSPAQIARIDRDLIAKYTGDLAWRTMGYSTPETKHLKENPNWTETNKFTRFAFGGGAITAMDGWAASVLWPWAENKVRRDFPDLEVGTQEQIDAGQSPFYKKVAEEFNEAVARSQSVSDEIHQGTLRKSRNPVTRAFTMFKSDSAQGYNALRQKIGEAKYYERAGDTENARKAKKAVGATFVSLIGGYLWASLVSFLIALWKNKGKYYRDDEGELTFESVAKEMVMDLSGSLVGVVAGGEELMDILGNVLTGDTWYGVDTPGLEQLTDIIELLQKETTNGLDTLKGAVDVVQNGGDLGEYLKRHGNDILGGIKELAEAAGTYIPGVPVSNLEAYILGGLKWISPELGTAYDDLLTTAEKSGLSGLKGDALEQRVGSILSGRLNEIPEGAAAEMAGLCEAGYTQAVPGDTPAKITVNGEERDLGAYQQQVYETVWRESVEAPLARLLEQEWYTGLGDEARAKVLAKLYDYGAQSAKSALFDEFQADSFVEEISAYQAAGLDAADWLEAWRKFSEIEDSGANASARATEFSYWADTQGYTPEQARVVKDSFTVFSHIPVEAERYGDLQAAGLSDSEARELTSALAELEPLEGAASVSDMQRLRTIADAGLDQEKMVAAMGTILGTDMTTESGGKSQYALLQEALADGYTVDEWLELKEAGYMTESAFEKVRISGRYDISPAQYIRYREMLVSADALNEDPEKRNNSIDQDETAAAVNGMLGLSNEQKAVLWQLQNKSWKPNKNPFDTAVGQTVYDYLHEEGLPSLTGGGELPPLSLPSLGG